MKKRLQRNRFRACLCAALALCLAGTTVTEAATVYEMYELVEGTPSESGYIPTMDPVEELTGETILPDEEVNEESQDSFSDGDSFSEETGSAAVFSLDDNSSAEEGTVFDDGSSFSDGEENVSEDSASAFVTEEITEAENTISAFSDEEPETENLYGASGLPVRYSLTDYGYNTAVKNQKNLGTCWAFSCLESIETGLIKKGLADSSLSLSETHLAYSAFHGTTSDSSDPTSNETFLQINNQRWTRLGGNRYYSIATLGRGYGPVYESMYPLDLTFQADAADSVSSTFSILDAVITDQDKRTSVSRLRNCYWLYELNSVTGSARIARVNDIKKFIMNYGAVEVGLYTNSYSAPYDAETNSFYSENAVTPNHSVTLIGWDDEKVTKASTPGAFLMQNSWGDGAGENGIFWVSYEDRSIKSPSFYEMENSPLGSSGDEVIHQYDGTGYGSVIKPAQPSDTLRISGANVFTADTAQYINEVSFYAAAAPISYTISIYRYVKSSPDTGILVHSQDGSTQYAGYFTVDLTKSIPVAKGEKFAVQLQFNHKNGYVPHEKANNRAYDVQAGQSYLYDGTAWVDMTKLNYKCNICIKAIGTKTSDTISMAPQKPSFSSVKVTNYTKVTAALNSASDKPDGYDFVIGTSSSFLKTRTYKQVVKNNTTGTATFTSLAKGTYYVAVHAYRLDANGKKAFSSWSDIKKITVTVGLPSTRKLSSVKVTNGNHITATVASSSAKVSGYDFAIGKKSDFTKTGTYYKTSVNITKTSTTFAYIPKGTYYVAVRTYNLTPSKSKVCGAWSSTVKVVIAGTTPGTPKFKTVTAGKGTLKATYTKASRAYRYEYVLTTKAFSAATLSPSSKYKYYTGKTYAGISLSNLKKGTYYLGVRAYTMYGKTKVYGKWVIKKVTIR